MLNDFIYLKQNQLNFLIPFLYNEDNLTKEKGG